MKTEAAVKAARAAHEKAGGAVAAATEPDARSKAEAALSLCKQELDAAQVGVCHAAAVWRESRQVCCPLGSVPEALLAS